MKQDPRADNKSKNQPNKIAGRLICRPYGFALGRAEMHHQDDYDDDKDRAERDAGNLQVPRYTARYISAIRTYFKIVQLYAD